MYIHALNHNYVSTKSLNQGQFGGKAIDPFVLSLYIVGKVHCTCISVTYEVTQVWCEALGIAYSIEEAPLYAPLHMYMYIVRT